jgi:DNA-binding transcriptional ArsR family regulator
MNKQDLKSKIEKLEKGIISKVTPENLKASLKSQKEKFEKELADLEKKEKSDLSKKIKDLKASVKTKSTSSSISRDGARKAKKAGKRIAEDGSVYYEKRANRTDSQTSKKPYLEKGGKLDKDISDKIEQDLKLIVTKKEKYEKELKQLKDEKSQDKDTITYLEYELESLNKLYDKLSKIKNESMAKGGNVKNFNPQSIIGKSIDDMKVTSVEELPNEYFWVTRETYTKGLTIEQGFSKDDLIKLSKGEKVEGLKMMSKGGSVKRVPMIYEFKAILRDEDDKIKEKKEFKVKAIGRDGAYNKAYKKYPKPYFVELYNSYAENKMAKGGELNKRKTYSIKQLKELGFKQVQGDKKYRYYFEKDGEINEFRVIPSIGINSRVVEEEDTILAMLSNGGKLAKGGDLYDDMDDDIEFANKKAKMIANSLKGMGYNIVEFTEADYDADANISLSENVNVNIDLDGELAIVTDEGDGKFLFMDCGKSYTTVLEKLKKLEDKGLVKRNTMDKMEKGGKSPRTIKLTLNDKDSYDYTYKQDGTTGTAAEITFGFGKQPFQYEVKKISKSLEPFQQDILDAFTIQGIKQHEYKGGFSEAIKHLDTKVVYEDNFAKGGYVLVEGYDHHKNEPLYRVISRDKDNDYVGEWHEVKELAENEYKSLVGNWDDEVEIMAAGGKTFKRKKFVSIPVKEGDYFFDKPNAKGGYYNYRLVKLVDGNVTTIVIADRDYNGSISVKSEPFTISTKYVQNVIDDSRKEQFEKEQNIEEGVFKLSKEIGADKVKGGDLNIPKVRAQLYETLKNLASFEKNVKDSSVAAAPNSMTFRASQSGTAISVDTNNVQRGGYYDGDTPYILQVKVGGALSSEKQRIIMRVLQDLLSKYTFTTELGSSKVKETGGTNWSSVMLTAPRNGNSYSTLKGLDDFKSIRSMENGGYMADGGELDDKINHINNTYDGVIASKTYSSNRIQVVSPYFNTLSEIKKKEFGGSGLMEKYGNTSSYVLYSNKAFFEDGGMMMDNGGMNFNLDGMTKGEKLFFNGSKDFKPEYAIQESPKKELLIESYYWNYLTDELEVEKLKKKKGIEIEQKEVNDWKVAKEVEEGELVETSPYETRYMYSPSLNKLREQTQGEWYQYGSVSDTFADGGMMAKGGEVFTIGTNVYILDPSSMFKGKTGFISGEVGNKLLVTFIENGNERSVVVSRKGVEILDEPEYAKGGEVEKYKVQRTKSWDNRDLITVQEYFVDEKDYVNVFSFNDYYKSKAKKNGYDLSKDSEVIKFYEKKEKGYLEDGGMMAKGGSVSQNIDVFGYQTMHFDMCPLAVEEFEKAVDVVSQTDSDAKKTALSRAAMYVDDVLGVEKKAKEDNIVSKNEFQYAVTQSLVASAYNYASGLEVNLTKFLPMHIFEIATKLVHTDQEARKDELTSYDMFVAKGVMGDAVFNNMTQEERRNLAIELKKKKSFEDGGSIEESNYRMVVSQAKAIKHHADELLNVLTPDIEVEAWVVGKIERASTDLSDITHYIDGLKGETDEFKVESDTYFAEGGQLEKGVYYLGKPKKEGSVWAQKIVELDETGLSFATDYGRKLKDFPSKDYKKISEEELSEFIKSSPKHQNVSSDTAKFEYYAAGGMIVGRYYKDNQGEEYRYIGEDKDGQPLFSDGQKVAPKSLDDFESDAKETKLFRFFENGGEMAGGGFTSSFSGTPDRRKVIKEQGGYMAKGGEVDKEMSKVSELVKSFHKVKFASDAAASNDENAKSIRLLDRADDYRKEATILIDTFNKKNNTNFSFQDFNRNGSLREGISSGLKVPEEYTNPKAEEARYKYVVETKYPYDKQVFITNFSQEERERDPSYKAALDVLKKAQKNKEFQEGHIMFSFYIKGFGTSYSTVLHTKNKMAKGGTTDYERNLVNLKVGDVVVEYKKPNSNQPKREMGGQGKIILISDAMAKVEYENNYEIWIPLKDLKKIDSKMAMGGVTDNWEKTRTRKLKTKEEAEKAIKLFAQNMGKAGRNYKVEKMDDGYVISYESKFTEAMDKGGEIPDVIKRLISDMQDRNVAMKTIKVKKGSDGHLKFMKDVQPAIDKKILIVRHNPIDDNEMFISLIPNHLHKMADGGKINIGTIKKTDTDVLFDKQSGTFYVNLIDGANNRVNKVNVNTIDDVFEKYPTFKLNTIGQKEFLDSMAMGGKVKFEDKVKAIKESLLKRKKVSPKVQKDYGKTYSPKEAEQSAKRIAGSMRKKEMK